MNKVEMKLPFQFYIPFFHIIVINSERISSGFYKFKMSSSSPFYLVLSCYIGNERCFTAQYILWVGSSHGMEECLWMFHAKVQ